MKFYLLVVFLAISSCTPTTQGQDSFTLQGYIKEERFFDGNGIYSCELSKNLTLLYTHEITLTRDKTVLCFGCEDTSDGSKTHSLLSVDRNELATGKKLSSEDLKGIFRNEIYPLFKETFPSIEILRENASEDDLGPYFTCYSNFNGEQQTTKNLVNTAMVHLLFQVNGLYAGISCEQYYDINLHDKKKIIEIYEKLKNHALELRRSFKSECN